MTTILAVYRSTSVLGAPPSKLSADTRLGEENKGHQLLMKMGMYFLFLMYYIISTNSYIFQ